MSKSAVLARATDTLTSVRARRSALAAQTCARAAAVIKAKRGTKEPDAADRDGEPDSKEQPAAKSAGSETDLVAGLLARNALTFLYGREG